MKKLKNCPDNIIIAAKYIFPLILPVFVACRNGKEGFIPVAVFEVMMIALLGQVIRLISPMVARLVTGIFLIVFQMQYAVQVFAYSFTNTSMLDNLDSLQDISGKFYIYIPLVLLLLIMSFLPERQLRLPVRDRMSGMLDREQLQNRMMISALLIGFLASMFLLSAPRIAAYSVYINTRDVLTNLHEIQEQRREIAAKVATLQQEEENEDYQKSEAILKKISSLNTVEFYRNQVENAVQKPEGLPEHPNVILIFTEGLSQEVVEDQRELMPNLAKLESEGVFFKDYYNHTFATYMGLSGQLYSGYQQGNLDPNVLVSLQDSLHLAGYQTAFINTEPKNAEFTSYLENFDFDELLTSDQLNGKVESISDKDAYSMIFEEAMKRDKEEEPFFLSIYTFGTHVNIDSPDEVYEEGTNFTLNRMVNLDKWLGEFMEKFRTSPLAQDTLLVFTADHASYHDMDYINAFPYSSAHYCCDRIPLVFYYSGITPEVVEAGGRNSLNLAPTIMDYLDISNGNCFLGESLFIDTETVYESNPYANLFYSEGTYFRTNPAGPGNVASEQKEYIENQFRKYFFLKLAGVMEEDVPDANNTQDTTKQ